MAVEPGGRKDKELMKKKLEVLQGILGGEEELSYLLEEDLHLFLTEYKNYLREALSDLGVEETEGVETEELEEMLVQALKGRLEFSERMEELEELFQGAEGGEEKTPEKPELTGAEKEPAGAKAPRRAHLKLPRWGTFKMVMAAAVVIIVLSAAYYTILSRGGQNKKVVLLPYIDASATECYAGEVVTLDATRTFIRSSVKEIELNWIIVPEDYRILEGDLNSEVIKLYFTHSGSYNVTLMASHGEVLKEYSVRIEVDPITITVERLRWGDEYRYYTEGNVSLHDSEGIEYLFEEGLLEITDATLHFWNPPGEEDRITLEGDGGILVQNGFGQEAWALNLHLNQYLEISGEATVNGGEGVIPISGQQTYRQDKYVDLYYRHPFKVVSDTFIDMSFLISGQSVQRTYSIDDVEYPSTELADVLLSLDAVKESRVFEEDEDGFFTVGGYTYQWRIVGTERVGERPCFKMEIKLERELVERLGLEDYHIFVWLGNYIPVPVKVNTTFTAAEGSTSYSVELKRTLEDYQPGDFVVLFGQQSAYHPLVEDISELKPAYRGEKYPYGGLSPGQGNMSSSVPEGFTLDDIFTTLEEKSRYRQFMTLHPSARLAYANISEEGPSLKRWEILIEDPEGEDALRVIALQSSPENPIIVETTSTLSLKVSSEGVYSFSAAEALAKDCFDRDNVTMLLYGKSSPGEEDQLLWNGLTFRFTSYYPLIPAGINSLTGERGLYYSFEKTLGEGNTKYIVFNAESGALQSYAHVREMS